MNRPIRRKIELAALAWLNINSTDTALEGLTMLTGNGTTLTDELAFDSSPASRPVTNEPQPPFLAASVTVEAEDALAHVYSFKLTLHVRTDATDESASRTDIDDILRDANNIMTQPADADAVARDGNAECSAFLAYFAKPETPPDTRPSCCVPIAFYDLTQDGAADDNDGTIWDGQINFTGYVQDMDAFDYPA